MKPERSTITEIGNRIFKQFEVKKTMQEPIYDQTNQKINILICFMDFSAWKIQGMNDREQINRME